MTCAFDWPASFARIPREPWTEQPVEARGLKYDAMKAHRWYRNLDRTVGDVLDAVRPGAVFVDYSCGTGILAERLLRASREPFGIVNVDVLPTFLRVALDKLGRDARTAYRVIPSAAGKLAPLDEVLGEPLGRAGIDGLVCTNAIHLYDDLEGTIAGWSRALRPGARLFVQSGEIRNPRAKPGELLITDFVRALRERAVAIVRRDDRFLGYRAVLDDAPRMLAYEGVYEKIFQPPKAASAYVDVLARAGFEVDVTCATIQVGVDEWYQAAAVYSDIVAWIGGTSSVDGRPPSDAAMADRLAILEHAKHEVFGDKPVFDACWTYLSGRLAGL